MKSTILETIRNSREPLSKYAVAVAVPCGLRTAQRYTIELHKEGKIHIADWTAKKGSRRAMYAYGPGEDIEKPPAKSQAEMNAEYRIKYRDQINARKRGYRESSRKPAWVPPYVTYGFWGI